MSPPVEFARFREGVAGKVADPTLQEALHKALGLVRTRSSAAMTDFSDSEGQKEQVCQVRRASVARLPDLLALLESNLVDAGTMVLWAKDAAEVRRYVRDIAASHGCARGILSKSMVGEEVDLEHELTVAGVSVIQTDLGERVVQLAGEKPSHITAPCLHMTAAEVGQLLERTEGMTYSDVPEDICRFLAQRLRPEFLEADLGVSGVNLAVAATGHLVLVENEGNVRMGYTLPDVHVALLGVERIVETWQQADHVLAVLPRMATGQRATSYLSLLGPSPLPGQTRYVIFVDNGRSRLARGGPFHELLRCIRCGACMNVCPVYEKVGGHAYGWTYPGPIGIAMMPVMKPGPEALHAGYLCTLCGACSEVCPAKIPLDKLIVLGRNLSQKARLPRDYRRERRPFRWLSWAFGGPRRFRWTHWWHRMAARISPKTVERIESRLGWGDARKAPRPDPILFRTRFSRDRCDSMAPHDGNGGGDPVVRR